MASTTNGLDNDKILKTGHLYKQGRVAMRYIVCMQIQEGISYVFQLHNFIIIVKTRLYKKVIIQYIHVKVVHTATGIDAILSSDALLSVTMQSRGAKPQRE